MNVSPGKIYFVDTNILVYAYDISAGQKHHLAEQFLEQCWENGNGCLSIQVLQEFYVSVTRKIIHPLDHLTARHLVSNFTRWRLHVPDGNDLLQAIDLQHSYGISFWDALVLHSASCMGCNQMLSEGLNHGEIYDEVQVINPFLQLMN
jgi:predicted nucleic acid-binding protein